ncbi:MAG: PAS domain S-box protein, partial [Bacteroidia bacterium]|nr:PAS domain S-box protein [Bacteroidia bacterium]
QTERLFGYTKEELIGEPVEILIPATLHHNHIRHREKFTKDPHVRAMGAGMELEALKKDGSKFPVEISLSPLQTEEGILILASVRDITNRKKIEKDLSILNAELEQRVKDRTEAVVNALEEKNIILESIADAFFAVNKNWTVTYWNRIAETAMRVSKKEIIGKNLWEIFSDSIDSESYRQYHQAIETNQVVHFEDYYPVLNLWYEISAYPSENGLSVYFKDITAKKAAEEDRLKMAYLIESTSDFVGISDMYQHFIYLNKAGREMVGYGESEDLSSKLLSDFVPDWTFKILSEQAIPAAMKTGKWSGEAALLTKTGNEVPVSSVTIIYKSPDGQPQYIATIARDITESKKSEEKIIKSEQRYRDLVNNITDLICTHDL